MREINPYESPLEAVVLEDRPQEEMPWLVVFIAVASLLASAFFVWVCLHDPTTAELTQN